VSSDTPAPQTAARSSALQYQSFFVPTIAAPVSSELLAVAEPAAGERVLDVACGTGVVARAAAERVGTQGSVTGVDLAPDMLEVAAATPAHGAPIEWRQADATALPLPDGSYDVALCQMGLMFVSDRSAAVAELYRVLDVGGRVAISTPGRIQAPVAAIEQAISEHIDPGLGGFVSIVFSMHDPALLADMLREAGFADVRSREYVATLTLPAPAEFLWNYLGATPIGPIVAQAPERAREALERDVIAASAEHGDDRTVAQPMALAWGRRGSRRG
jgi:ubiquinone/menaquinone biosynthesis C-methylase UbiE